MAKKREVIGASKALNKTITEVMTYLKDHGGRPGGPGSQLRPFLSEKLADLAERWYRKGFNRGHRESHGNFMQAGKVPKTLRYQASRQLYSGQARVVDLKSTLRSTKKSTPKSKTSRRP